MKVSISRFSPHQNAKVFSVLMAVGSLVFAVPMFIALSMIPGGHDAHGNPVSAPPAYIVLIFPMVYLVFGYVSILVGCWLYNLLYRVVGGFEYETH